MELRPQYPADCARCGPEHDRAAPPSKPDCHVTDRRFEFRCEHSVCLPGTKSAPRTPKADHPAWAARSLASPGLRAAGTFRSTSEHTRATAARKREAAG